MKRGFTKAYRKELESDIWKMPPLYQRVFFYLRQKVEWNPSEFPTKKGFKIAVNPGQLITSLSIISDGVSWYEYGVKRVPNKKTIKEILGWLESNGMVGVESNRHGTFIIVRNWDIYNVDGRKKVTPKEQGWVTPKKRSLDTPKEYIKNLKELSLPSDVRIGVFLFSYILENNPNKKIPDFDKWAKDVDKIIRIDKRNTDDLKKIIRWSQKDDFWKSNILSPANLRKNYDRLFVKMNSNGGKPKEDEAPQRPKMFTGDMAAFVKDNS